MNPERLTTGPDAKKRGPAAAVLAAARPKQWVKNFLVFVPYITSHSFLSQELWRRGIVAFASLSLCASGTYILNDLIDVESDRTHPLKKHRPFASADLPLACGPFLAVFFLAAGFLVARLLPPSFMGLLTLYALATTAYSLVLKRLVFIDVLCLATLYTLRILAGQAASGIEYSQWITTFSVFLFLSLAIMKRYSELLFLREHDHAAPPGRGYRLSDEELLVNFGTTSGYLAVLVFALYVNSQQVRTLYRRPDVLWLMCPLLLLWISRVWLLTRRGMLKGDPLIFMIGDRGSYLMGLATAAIMAAAGAVVR